MVRNVRTALKPGGTVIVVDEGATETFTHLGDEVERFFVAAGPIWCLPRGLVGSGPRPVGTLIGLDRVRALGSAFGYCAVEVVPVEHRLWWFYRLVP